MSTAACDQAPPPTALEPDSEECEYIIVEFNAADHSAADILATVESMTVQKIFGEAPRVSVDGGMNWYRGRFQHSLGTELLCQAPAAAPIAGESPASLSSLYAARSFRTLKLVEEPSMSMATSSSVAAEKANIASGKSISSASRVPAAASKKAVVSARASDDNAPARASKKRKP